MPDTLENFFACCPSMLFIADADGTLRHRSRALDERVGHRLTRETKIGALVDTRERPAFERFLAELGETDGSYRLWVPGPNGDPSELRCLARRAADRTIHGQLELAVSERVQDLPARLEHVLLRTIMTSLDIVLWAVDHDGTFVFHDGKALDQAGLKPGQFLGMNIFELYPPELVAPVREALTGTASHLTSEAHGIHWETWNIPVPNEAGETEYCASVTLDVTPQVISKRNLERQLQTIRRQQQAIHELSAPIINVWDSVLTVPLIGMMDAERTNELTDRLLAEVHRAKTRFAILDLTGVEAVDTSIASHVLRLLDSLRLLGVEGMVTGVSPQVAQTMVGVGIQFESVLTHRTLREGLRYCMRALRGR